MKIAVIGTGGMGKWFAKEFSKTEEVAVYDINKRKMQSIKNVIHLKGIAELQSFNPELLLNAVSLQNTIKVFEGVRIFLNRECIISDIASIKGEIPEYYQKSSFPFVSFHPMFGPRLTNLNHIKEENVIIISESDAKAKKFLKNFFKKYNTHIIEISFNNHDELMSYSLTLPFTSSIVFSACLTTHVVPGTTFARHKKIARRLLKEDDYLIADILFNRHSIKQLEEICSRLEFLKHIIKARDYEEARKFFNKLRKNLGN